MKSSSPRKASREHRRQQIIDATLAVVARNGLSEITLSQIAKAAGVSHGLVNFHFESKEKLLLATLRQLSDEYSGLWTSEVAKAGPDPARQLDALVRADLDETVYTPDKIAAWCAYWGEVKTRQVYQQLRAPFDDQFQRAIASMCAALTAETKSTHDPVYVARVVHAVLDENWLTPLFENSGINREDKLKTVYCCLSAFFPSHFTAEGLIRR